MSNSVSGYGGRQIEYNLWWYSYCIPTLGPWIFFLWKNSWKLQSSLKNVLALNLVSCTSIWRSLLLSKKNSKAPLMPFPLQCEWYLTCLVFNISNAFSLSTRSQLNHHDSILRATFRLRQLSHQNGDTAHDGPPATTPGHPKETSTPYKQWVISLKKLQTLYVSIKVVMTIATNIIV